MLELESWGSVWRPLAAVLLLFAAAAGVGRLLVPGFRGLSRSDLVLLRLIIGVNLVGLAGVGLGILRLLPAGRSLWLLAGLSVLAPMLVRFRMLPEKKSTSQYRDRPTGIAPLLALSTLGLITLGPSLCYPGGWDELVYHCVLPRRWLAEGWPAVYLDLPYSAFPSLGEILFWLMAPIDSLIAPRLLIWACWMLGLICLFRVLRRLLSDGFAVTLTLVFATSGTVLLISADCYVESIVMMNVAALLLATERTNRASPETEDVQRQNPEGSTELRRAVILGALAGAAVAVKPTGGGVLAVPLLLYASEAWGDRSRWKQMIKPLALSLLVALAVCIPFYIRPWLATGNPLYPYLCEWFSNEPGRIEMSRYHHDIGGSAFGVKTAVGFISAPVMLAFQSRTYDGYFGWPLLVLIVLAALALGCAARKQVHLTVLWPAAVSVSLYLFWFATAQQARFAVPAFLAFSVVAAEGLRLIRGRWRLLVIAALVLAASANVPGRAGFYWYSWLALVGEVSRLDHLNAATEGRHLPAVEAVAARTPPDAKIMLLFEHRSLYIPRECQIGTPLFQERFFSPVPRYTEPDRILEVLAENQFTHALVARDRVGPDQAPGAAAQLAPFLQALDRCVRQGQLEPVWRSEHYLLLKVNRGASSR